MEMILEKKHGTTNYGSKESGNQIGDDLLRMTPEETVYRSYYRMEQGLDKFSAEEESQIRNTYGDILSRYFPPTEAEPYCLHDATVNESSPIVVRKRSRYFPAVLYHRPCFELIYLYSGQCTHICKGQQYELRQGDFCLLEYGASHRIFNNSDYSILIELLIFPKILNKICATLLSENSVLSNFFHNALYGNRFCCKKLCYRYAERISAKNRILLHLFRVVSKRAICHPPSSISPLSGTACRFGARPHPGNHGLYYKKLFRNYPGRFSCII